VLYTVFCTAADATMQRQAELLEYSWGRVRQPGELVRLVASPPGTRAPSHRFARVVQTLAWSPHPYTGDAYPPYDTAASLLEWLFVERIEGTVLLLDPRSIFRAPVVSEAGRGRAQAMAWPGLPRGDGPFGLGPDFGFLERFCVDRSLALPAVTLPLLIHASDLRRIAARWLELTSIIRAETAVAAGGPRPDAGDVAYAIAAAEGEIRHTERVISVGTDAAESAAPIVDYRRPVASTPGGIVWDAGADRQWDSIDPERAPPGTGREFLTILAGFVARRDQGAGLAFLRPCRRKGVREGRLLGSLFLDIPGRSDTVSLNSTGAAIWEFCDGARSLADINADLEARFAMPPGSLRTDVQAAIDRLERIGALRLEPV
jgi:hypothetical protein